MVTIQQISKEYIRLSFVSYYHYVIRDNRLEDIPGVVRCDARKYCVVPLSSLPFIRAEFDGEIYYKTPLWKLLGQSEPEKAEIKFFGPEPDVPSLALKPYEYQNEGIKFMIDRLNNEGFVLNGDGVGLGKTLQTIGTIKWFVENRGARKILIICKKSIKTQWSEEIRRIADWQKVPIFVTGSTKKKRSEAYEGIRNSRTGILITNYHSFLNDSEEINTVNYDICVIDEAHCIKGKDGKMNNLIAETVSGKRTILLTGTPIMSRPEDIYGIVSMVSPNFFGTYDAFEARYMRMADGKFGRQMFGVWHLDELQEKIQRFLIMRSAEDVALELPKRKLKCITCEMDSLQKRMHEIVSERIERINEELDKVELSGMPHEEKLAMKAEIAKKINAYNAPLQFIADDPSIFRYRDWKKGPVNYQLARKLPASYRMSEKTAALLDLVSEIVNAGEKAIIFCHWETSTKMLCDRLEQNKITVVRYTGREDDEERAANVDAFKSDPSVNVMIGTDAMAEGLNLQVCPFLINYEQADTDALKDQRSGRIRRIGSRYESVYIIDLVTKEKDSKDVKKMRKMTRDGDMSSGILVQATA